MTICHETPSGQKQTLTLPRTAALNHLLRHPLDTVGECARPIIEPEVVPEPVILPETPTPPAEAVPENDPVIPAVPTPEPEV